MSRTFRPVAVLLATTALAAALGGCKPDNSPPPAAVSGTPPLGPLDPVAAPAAYAPAPAPAAPPAQAYAYPQRAYQMSRVVHQRPPSYAFGYGEEQPYVWDDGDQGEMFAEPIDDGYRYYYYEPGADYPYFVQDPDYGYAYGPNGALIGLFAATGALIAADHWRDHAPRAQGYWTRGYDLDRAYRHSTRYPVLPAVWRERAPAFYAGHDRWFRAAQAQPGWRQAATWTGGPGHDNGRHLGWFKDHGGERDRGGRRFADAGPAGPRFQPQRQPLPAQPGRTEHGQSHGDHGWRQARQDQPAPRPNHGGHGGREARAGAPPRPVAQQGQRPGGGDHGGWNRSGGHGGENHGGGQAFARAAPQPQPHGGGQAFARAAEPHGANASWRGGGGPHGGGQGGHGPGGGAPGGGGGHGGGNHGGGGGDKGGHGHDR